MLHFKKPFDNNLKADDLARGLSALNKDVFDSQTQISGKDLISMHPSWFDKSRRFIAADLFPQYKGQTLGEVLSSEAGDIFANSKSISCARSD